MALFELKGIEMKFLHHMRALAVVPPVGEQHSADIEEDYVEGEHQRLLGERRFELQEFWEADGLSSASG
jgi:hypothetical protein